MKRNTNNPTNYAPHKKGGYAQGIVTDAAVQTLIDLGMLNDPAIYFVAVQLIGGESFYTTNVDTDPTAAGLGNSGDDGEWLRLSRTEARQFKIIAAVGDAVTVNIQTNFYQEIL